MGGGPVGIEFSQMLARLGTKVTMVEKAGRLLQREEPRVGELLREILVGEGIEVRAGRQVKGVSRDGGSTKVALDDGSTITTDIVLVATGRRPRMADLGLGSVGVQPGERGLPVDDRCRLADGLWAIGDVTGVMPFTHVAKYQGRIVADNILGRSRTADYRGVPRVVFSDPEVAAVGLTEDRAREEGVDVVTATVDIPGTLARPWTYEREPRGELRLIADRSRRVLVGAWAVAPLAGEWIHFAALAVRAQIPVDVLRDAVPQFPTYSEAFLYGLEALDL
jgi:dihydrolipoamide dehydrogenase